MDLEKFLNKSNLDLLYESKHHEFENHIREKYYINEEKKVTEDEEKLTNTIRDYIADDAIYQEILKALNEFETSVSDKGEFWNKLYYKYGYVDANNTQSEINNFEKTELFIKEKKHYKSILKKMQDEDFVENK